jgi:hypothetical protein
VLGTVGGRGFGGVREGEEIKRQDHDTLHCICVAAPTVVVPRSVFGCWVARQNKHTYTYTRTSTSCRCSGVAFPPCVWGGGSA